MSLLKPIVMDGRFERVAAQGDVIGGAETLANSSLTTAGSATLTAAIITSGFCIRSGPIAAYGDTTDTATDIIAALSTGLGSSAASPGDTFRLKFTNTVGFANTIAAGTGVTLGTVPTTEVAASSTKDFLVTLTNTTPASTVSANTTNASKVLTGMTQAQTAAVSVGMAVTGTGIGASAVVTSVQPGVGVNVSVASTATASAVAVTFSPTVRIDALSMP